MEGRDWSPAGEDAGAGSPAGAEEGSGPGTPLRFPFRGARCRRAFPGKWRPLRGSLGQPRIPALRGKNDNNKERGVKSKVAAVRSRAGGGERGERPAAGGPACLPGSQPAL